MPIIGQTVFTEYEDVPGREPLFRKSPLSKGERRDFLHSFLGVCEWVHVYYSWRPNLQESPEEKHARLRTLAEAKGVSLNRLMDEFAAVALAQFDSEARFRALAAKGFPKIGLSLLEKLDRAFEPQG